MRSQHYSLLQSPKYHHYYPITKTSIGITNYPIQGGCPHERGCNTRTRINACVSIASTTPCILVLRLQSCFSIPASTTGPRLLVDNRDQSEGLTCNQSCQQIPATYSSSHCQGAPPHGFCNRACQLPAHLKFLSLFTQTTFLLRAHLPVRRPAGTVPGLL